MGNLNINPKGGKKRKGTRLYWSKKQMLRNKSKGQINKKQIAWEA